MNTFKKDAAQGEISIEKIEKIPGNVTAIEPENDVFVIGHSESGHHHVLEREGVQVFEAKTAPAGMKILFAILDKPAGLKHMRGHDTHETITHQPGIYEFRLGREYDPYAELARRVAD